MSGAAGAGSGGSRTAWSPLAGCGPLSLLGGSFLFVAGATAVDGPRSAALSCGVLAVALLALVGSCPPPLVRLVPGLLAVLSVTWSNWLLAAERSWATAAGAGLRVAFFVVPGTVFASYLDPLIVGDHLGQRLRLPARPVLAFVAALQRFEDLGQDWADAARVRRVRGLDPGRSPVARVRHGLGLTFTLLVEAIRKAGRMTIAMEARGYSAARTGRRGWAQPAPWTGADTGLLVVCAVLAAVPFVLSRWG